MNNLLQFLYHPPANKCIDGFNAPGYWTTLAAYCRDQKITFGDLKIPRDELRQYACAIGLETALNQTDSYPFNRINSGKNYSPLVLLNSADETNKANSAIISCIRYLFQDTQQSDFINDLSSVIGDLHDNVWSHGKSTGFSMAQKWKDNFEFSLADCGLGFLRELQRVNLKIQDDESAINWCIQEGNSSKKTKKADEWSQRLPADMMGSPMPNAQIIENDNNHMGLGLAKLLNLVNTYQGRLWLASGEKTLVVEPNGNKMFKTNNLNWKGVTLACRFNIEAVKNCHKNNTDEATDAILDLLNQLGW